MANELFPVFLKVENLQILIVGGGFVGTEKVSNLLKSSPNANITVVAPFISDEINELAKIHSTLFLQKKTYEIADLENKQIVIAGTANQVLNQQIWQDAKQKNIIVNVADTPNLCDFYMGSIVTKGDLKIGISTNGKSPTLSKRLREFFEAVLPENINELILHLQNYRNQLKGDFEHKINELNKITAIFTKDKK